MQPDQSGIQSVQLHLVSTVDVVPRPLHLATGDLLNHLRRGTHGQQRRHLRDPEGA